MGGLRQGSLWRTATRPGVSRPLHPSCGHLQPPPPDSRKRSGLLPVEGLPRRSQIQGDDHPCRGVHPPLPAARFAARLTTHPLLRLPGQLPPQGQTRSLPSTAGHGHLPVAAPACRLPQLTGSTHQHQLPALPAVWERHPHPSPILPALSRPRSPPSGQLMISPGLNPLPFQRCLPGRAYSTCAYAPSDAARTLIGLANYPSASLFSRLPATFRLPAPPHGSTGQPTHLSPAPQTTTLQTQQNPLKTGVRAKV